MNTDTNKIIRRFFAPDEDFAPLMATWDKSIASFPGTANISFIQDNFIRKYAAMGNLPAALIETVIADKNHLIEDQEQLMLLWHCYNYIYGSECKRKNVMAMPCLETTLPSLYGNFFILLVLAGFPGAIELYKKRRVPENILAITLKDLYVWVEQYQHELGITGLTKLIVGWMMRHLNCELFKLGRLQFEYPFMMHNNIMVFQHKITHELQVLSGDGIRYNSDGLIDGIGNVWDEAGHWLATLQETDDFIVGNPISVAGYAKNRLVKLDVAEWTNVLRGGDKVLNIHIPAGEPLTPEACNESFEQAKQFFNKYFPDYKAKAFVCFSWLLDNQFAGILKPTSNILQFQHLGWLFPAAEESEAIYRVFGKTAVEAGIDAVPHVSSMQRAIAKFLHNGGVLRNGGLFLLTENHRQSTIFK